MSIQIPLTREIAKAKFAELLAAAEKEHPAEGSLLKKFFENPLIKSRWERTPGSTALRFHHAFDGGLMTHTMEIIVLMQEQAKALGEPYTHTRGKGWRFTSNLNSFVSMLEILQAGLLHDINKLGDAAGREFYVPNFIKGGSVRSDKVPYETSDALYDLMSHLDEKEAPQVKAAHLAAFHTMRRCWRDLPDGELSLAVIAGVSPELYVSLSENVKFAIRHHDGAYGRARRDLTGNESPLQMILHLADMWSSRMNKEDYR